MSIVKLNKAYSYFVKVGGRWKLGLISVYHTSPIEFFLIPLNVSSKDAHDYAHYT